jgi:hypothetical protein
MGSVVTPKKSAGKKTVANKVEKQRLPIKVNVVRELMFASGGRCAMTDCGLSLLSPSGGWVGTIAHIVAAELGGPRGAGEMSADERRSFGNLMLMCGTHGREVDDPETGEARYPIETLRQMKEAHEAKVLTAVKQAIDDEVSGIRSAMALIDTTLRPATGALTATGLAESLGVANPADLLPGLAHVQARLQRLSQVGLDALSQLLRVWLLHCYDHTASAYDFGDISATGPSVPIEKVTNRVGQANDHEWAVALDELESSELVETVIDEYDHVYLLKEPWTLREGRYTYNFWISAAHFLHFGYGVEIPDWIRSLDFSIYDRPAPPGRPVPWR